MFLCVGRAEQQGARALGRPACVRPCLLARLRLPRRVAAGPASARRVQLSGGAVPGPAGARDGAGEQPAGVPRRHRAGARPHGGRAAARAAIWCAGRFVVRRARAPVVCFSLGGFRGRYQSFAQAQTGRRARAARRGARRARRAGRGGAVAGGAGELPQLVGGGFCGGGGCCKYSFA